MSINSSGGHGFEFKATNNANLNTNIVNSRALLSKADGIHYEYNNATGENSVNGFDGSSAADNGAEILLFSGSFVRFNQFDNGTFNSAKNSGLQVGVLTGSTLDAFNSTGVTANNNGGSGALLTTLASTSNFVFTNLTTNNNVIRGVQIGENMAGVSTKTFNNITAIGNKLGQAMGIGVGNGASLNLLVNGGTLSTVGSSTPANVIYAPIRGASTANLNFNGLNTNNSTSSGFVIDYDQASQGTLNISDTTSTGNNAVGVALFIRGGSDVDANFDNVDVSNAGQTAAANGFRVEVVGAGTHGDLTFDGVNVSGAAGTGLSVLLNASSTATIDQFNDVTASGTGGDGINVHVRGVATHLMSFNATGVNASGAGQGTNGSADGLDISVVGPGAMGHFDIQNLNADSNAGRGLKVQVENTATMELDVNNFSLDSNLREGALIDVGTVVAGSKLLGGTFANGTASSNGLEFMVNYSGINTNVVGTGTMADLIFDAVLANSNTSDGFSFNTTAGAQFTTDVRNGVSALGNAAHGLDFRAAGATTVVSLLSTVAGNNYSGNQGNGFNVVLTAGVTANEITKRGSASTNQGDGVHISAIDRTGVEINSLQITGLNPMFNGNQGNGLFIDLDLVGGLNVLDLSSLTVNNNVMDQIHVELTDMVLQDISLANINADGPGAGVGTGDGIELLLDNTDVTNSLGMNGITAVNNGQDGLELRFLNGATVPAGSVIDLGTFDDNGQHGVNIIVNASIITLGITNSNVAMGSIASMSDNGGNGLNILLTAATLTLEELDSQSILRNTGSGVRVEASIPSTFISNNSVTNNDISENGGFGFRGIFNSGMFDISIGGAGNGNIFEDNTGAGIAIDMVQSTIGQLRIIENEIFGTNDGGATFNGEAIYIRQLGTANPAQATNSLQNISGPAGSPGLLDSSATASASTAWTWPTATPATASRSSPRSSRRSWDCTFLKT